MMPKTNGWERPDIEAMTNDELQNHMDQMRGIGEGYLELYESGVFPPSAESWAGWFARTTPEFLVLYPFMSNKDILVSEMMAGWAANPPDTSMIKAIRQDDVNIHPFPGGCIFEQTNVMVLTDGTEVKASGVHVFYANEDGKIVRSHEYYDPTVSKDAGIDMGIG